MNIGSQLSMLVFPKESEVSVERLHIFHISTEPSIMYSLTPVPPIQLHSPEVAGVMMSSTQISLLHIPKVSGTIGSMNSKVKLLSQDFG